MASGYRFSLFRQLDRFPDFVAPARLTGVVTSADEDGVQVRMDRHIVCVEHWDNEIHCQSPYKFARDTIPA